jgi:hypothetical protein
MHMLAGKQKIIVAFCLSLALTGCAKGPAAWWASINSKAKHLNELEAKYQALHKEHEVLKREYFRLEHAHDALVAEQQSKLRAQSSLTATGSRTGRAPASIAYSVPQGLTADALRALAYEHFREKRFGEAALTFEYLLSQPEGAAVQGSDAYYSAGVAWFQVGNLRKSSDSFEAAKAHAEADEKEKVRKKVELWKRVIDRKLASEIVSHGGKHE